MNERGEFVPCAICDQPSLCAAVKPRSQPCWVSHATKIRNAADRIVVGGNKTAEIERALYDAVAFLVEREEARMTKEQS